MILVLQIRRSSSASRQHTAGCWAAQHSMPADTPLHAYAHQEICTYHPPARRLPLLCEAGVGPGGGPPKAPPEARQVFPAAALLPPPKQRLEVGRVKLLSGGGVGLGGVAWVGGRRGARASSMCVCVCWRGESSGRNAEVVI